MKKRFYIIVKGIVQGVGFRPFVYSKALKYNLKGWVNNNSKGVFIDLEGEEEDLFSLLKDLKNIPPPLSKIDIIDYEERHILDYSDFSIKESLKEEGSITLISPDVSTCKDCLEDINEINNRRYKYPFTNCTNCGPRFSIIKSIPYDRDKTTMKKFIMCPTCNREYKNPVDRRFHAQPNACPLCGPHLYVVDKFGKIISEGDTDSLNFTKEKLKDGKIFAIKGLGGFHLCCNGENEDSIIELRRRKNRKYKPFAVMMKDIEEVSKSCILDKDEKEALEGIIKPILILRRGDNYNLPDVLAPNQKTLGVMLPYTPLHTLIFDKDLKALVMTSANISSLPLEYKNEEAFDNLNNIVDYFLFHDRDIFVPIDDSVARKVAGEIRVIRRARGYVPSPFNLKIDNSILALGPDMKNTFAINKESYVFVSQFNGDLFNLQTINHYKNNINHLSNMFSFVPKYVAIDHHPLYESSKYGEEISSNIIKTYHHHAHIVSCMVENNLFSDVIGISFDGTGYGFDGNIWGSEFLISNRKSFNRVSHLKYVEMQGGDKSVEEPYRMGVSYINNSFKGLEAETIVHKLYGDNGLSILKLIRNNINVVSTSSMGRLFDACSSLMGIIDTITYEGQAAIEMESFASSNIKDSYSYILEEDPGEGAESEGEGESSGERDEKSIIICTENIIREILKDREIGEKKEVMASKFHNCVINIILEVSILLKNRFGINDVALSGGVFQNAYILENSIDKLRCSGFKVYSQSLFPSNDGGISLGQIVIASERIKNKE